MKLIKLLAVGAIAAASLSVASATTVRVTGSTAYRKALYAAIVNQLGSSTKAAYIGTVLNGANQATFSNGTDAVQACMAGSVGGINWVVNGVNVATSIGGDTTKAWITVASANSGAAATLSGGQATGGTAYTTATASFDAAGIADFTMSDSLQDSSPYSSTATGVTLVQAAGDSVGVVPFVFAKGKADNIPAASNTAFNNVSFTQFQVLASAGNLPLSFFTGISTDTAYRVALVGRDNDSGTRLGTAYETAFGDVNTAIKQYKAQDAANNDVGLAAGTIDHLVASFGTAGYASGGQVKQVLNDSLAAGAKIANKPFIMLGYVGTGDVPSAASQILTYNGVVESTSSVQYGQYTFWTYEQAYYLPTLDAGKSAIVEAIAGDIQSTFATSAGGILLGTMQASRSSEGSQVTPN